MEIRHRGEKPERRKPPMLALRNTLNIAFMVLAVVGCVIFQLYERQRLWGIVLITVAIAIKIGECILRVMLKKKENTDEEEK